MAPPTPAPARAPAPPATPEQERLRRLYAAMRSKRRRIEDAVGRIEAAEASARETGVSPARTTLRNLEEEVRRLLCDRERLHDEIQQVRDDIEREGDDPGEIEEEEEPRLPSSVRRRLNMERRRD